MKMDESLEYKVKQRIKEAKDKRIAKKAELIAKELGIDKEDRSSCSPHHHGQDLKVYNTPILNIEYGILDASYGGHIIIFESNTNKYDAPLFQLWIDRNNKQLTFKAYRPGPWEQKLDALYKNALQHKRSTAYQEKKIQQEKMREEQTNLKKAFGL